MIEVGRNSIVIRNVKKDSEAYKKIMSRFSLYDRNIHKYTFSAFYEYNNDLYFPSSVTLETIESFFPEKQIFKNFSNFPKPKPTEIILKHQPRDDLQKKAIQFLLKMRRDENWKQRFLSLPTGSGKTYVTINITSQLRRIPLIIVDTIDLAQQWKREFINHTNLSESDIIILSGQEKVDAQLKKPTGKVYVAIHKTLSNLISQDINSINSLVQKLGIGLRVFDEAHVDFGNICNINALSNVEYTLYLTATPSRSNFSDNTLYGRVFKVIPYFDGKELSGEKYHTVLLCKMNTHPSFDVQLSTKTKYGFSSARWAQYVETDAFDILLETTVNLFNKLNLIERKKKVAIMLPTIGLIKKLKENLQISFPKLDIGTFIGEVNKNKRIIELQRQIILTNDKIFDKGIDLQDLEILINFVPLASLVKVEQIMGRLRNRENFSSILIDITDTGFDACIKQSKIRKRFYKKKAKKIIEINE